MPTTHYDGGYDVLVGGYTGTASYVPGITYSGARAVPNFDLLIRIDSAGSDFVGVTVKVGYDTYANQVPDLLGSITGNILGNPENSYSYIVSGSDPEGDDIYYQWSWGDNDTTEWIGPFSSGANCELNHTWTGLGDFDITVRTKDDWGSISDWSAPLTVTMVCCIGDRGNIDGDELDSHDIGDLVYAVEYQFSTGPAPLCFTESDIAGDPVDNSPDGSFDISDIVFAVEFQFGSGPPPPPCF